MYIQPELITGIGSLSRSLQMVYIYMLMVFCPSMSEKKHQVISRFIRPCCVFMRMELQLLDIL